MTDAWRWRRRVEPRSSPRARVALIPGLGTTERLWAQVVVSLSPDVDVIVGELPGHGDQPTAVDFSMRDLADQALAALPGGEIPIVVVGHSMGGAIAVEMAKRAPQRLAGIVLVCSADRFGDPEGWQAHREEVLATGLDRIAERAPAGWFRREFIDAHAAVIARFVDDLAGVDVASYLSCCAALADYDGRGSLTDLQIPTVLIGATDDVGTPAADMQRMADEIPGAEFLVCSGAHLAPVEAPAVIASAITRLVSTTPAHTTSGIGEDS